MEIKAKLKHVRISPQKVRLVVDVIRGLGVDKALAQLHFLNKKATGPVEKLVKSAIANALNGFELNRDNLFVKEIMVDEGQKLKRWMPKARGRATPILKRTSHINLVLGELVDSGLKQAKKQEIEAPIKLDAGVDLEAGKTDAKKKKGGVEKEAKATKGENLTQKKTAGIFRRKTG